MSFCICKNCDEQIKNNETNCSVCNAHLHIGCEAKCLKCHNTLCFDCALKNKFECGTCKDEAKITMDFISATMFEAYVKCPYSFREEFILNTISEDKKNNKYSVVGTMLHDLFDKYSKIRPLNESVLKQLFNDYNKWFNALSINYFDGENDFDETKTLHTQTVNNWFNQEKTLPVPIQTEQQEMFKMHEELPTIRCTIDRINKIDEDYHVWDYKTGKVYGADKLRNNFQLPIYAMAVKQKFGVLPKTLTLHFPQHDNAKRIFELITDDIYVCVVKRGGTYTLKLSERLDAMVEIYSNIKKGIFPINASNTHFCSNFCPIGRAEQCDGVATAWKMNLTRGKD